MLIACVAMYNRCGLSIKSNLSGINGRQSCWSCAMLLGQFGKGVKAKVTSLAPHTIRYVRTREFENKRIQKRNRFFSFFLARYTQFVYDGLDKNTQQYPFTVDDQTLGGLTVWCRSQTTYCPFICKSIIIANRNKTAPRF